jgi:Mrp family chromosome partitioning ATPase
MQTTAVPRLQVITAGEVMNVHEDVVASSRLTEILQDLGVLVDVIVVVGPALSAGRDAAVLAAVSDVVVLVAELKATTLRQVRTSIRSLRDVGGQVLGVLIATPPAGRAVFLPTVAPRPRDESAGIQ